MTRGLAALAAALLASAGARTAHAADAATGKAVYDLRCAPCHGTTGAGDGPAAAALRPPPRNFRDLDFWRTRTPEQLHAIVKYGKPGTLMSPFDGVLSDAEIDDVVGYLKTFRPSGR
ncbi:MAG TPA: cytochrome c [Candidatus Binatia bacterium]|jgi:high-affinity iron transporter|nr:cytochrome c [Candidatus Binatia bacterium]